MEEKDFMEEELIEVDEFENIPFPEEECPVEVEDEMELGHHTFTALIDEIQAERDEYKNKYLLALADFDNYKKRMKSFIPSYETSGMTKVLLGMFQVMDDLERAIKMNKNNDDAESLKEGFELIYKKFISTLESMDVKMIDTDNVEFNTDYHEAVTMFAGTEEQKNKVVDCVQTGYTLKDKVIRHSKVVVGS